ncbi:hypothetical protein ACTFIT_011657 [Dictyostelium discoideum]
MQNNISCHCIHCQTVIKEINKKDNVNLKKHEKQPNDIGKIKFWPDQAIYWRGVFDGFDYIIFGVAVAAFSNINMSCFWATILTIGLNFFILLGRQALMWEYDLKKDEGRLSIESSYFNSLAPVDSIHLKKPFFFWEPSSDFQFNPIFNMFTMNFLNLFCAFLSLCFYFKLIGCVHYEVDGTHKSLFYYSPCQQIFKKTVIVNNGNNNQHQYNSIIETQNYFNQPIYYSPNKLELVMILLEKDHLNKFARECRKNRVHLELVFNKSETDRICGL